MSLPFTKMHGTGNDFVIFDARQRPLKFTRERLTEIAARRTGAGADQVIVMEPSKQADVFMRIFNADGSESGSCGNATRCIAWLVMEATGKSKVTVETAGGLLHCEHAGKQRVKVDMGEPRLDWEQIPLSEQQDTLHLELSIDGYGDPVAVSMGNPHAVFVVDDVAKVPLSSVGPKIEHHPLFPERVNAGFAHVVSDRKIVLRVWERGSGETLACGTGACAALVGLNRRGLVSNAAEVVLPGGTLEITWDKPSNHVFMTGPVVHSFLGVLHE
jgi:diaminopimelate epimerase